MSNRIEILLNAILSNDSEKTIKNQVNNLQKQLDELKLDSKLIEQLKELENIQIGGKGRNGNTLETEIRSANDELNKLQSTMEQVNRRKAEMEKHQTAIGFLFDKDKVIRDFEGVKREIEKRGGTIKFDVDVTDGKNEITALSATFEEQGKKITKVFDKIQHKGNYVWDITKVKNYDSAVRDAGKAFDKLSSEINKLNNDGYLTAEQFSKLNKELRSVEGNRAGIDQLANEVTRLGESTKHVSQLHNEMRKLATQGQLTDKHMQELHKTINSVGHIGKKEYNDLLMQIRQVGVETKKNNAQEINDLKTRERLINRLTDQQIKLERISRNKPKIEKFDNYLPTVDALNKLQTEKHTMDLRKFEKEVVKVSQSLDMMSAKATEAGRTQIGIVDSFKIAMEKFPVWMATTTVFYGSIRSAREFMSIIIDIDTKMTDLRKVMADGTDYGAVFDDARESAELFGQTISDTMDAYIEFARQGFDGDQLKELADAALVFSNVSELNTADAAGHLTATIVQYNKEASEAMDITDKWNEIGNNFATTSSSVAEGVNKSASVAKAMGMELEELNAMVAQLTVSTKQSGAEIG